MFLHSGKNNSANMITYGHSPSTSVLEWGGAKGVGGDCGKPVSPLSGGQLHPETVTGVLQAHWLSIVRPPNVSKRSWKCRFLCEISPVFNARSLFFHIP